jgi:hypothetical protein
LEEIIGDTTRDSEVQKLPAVEAQSSAPAFYRSIYDQRIRPGATEGHDLTAHVAGFHLDMHTHSFFVLPKAGCY